MKRIAPGLWIDDQDTLHISVPEILDAFGWPDNAHNREMVAEAARERFAKEWPKTAVHVLDICPDCGDLVEGLAAHKPDCPRYRIQ